MEMTSIENWLPGPGELIEFVPTADTLAAAEAESTPATRPSSIQAGHIRIAMERRSRGLKWSPWLALAFHVQTPLDRDALTRTVNTFVTRHGTLLSWFEGDVEDLQRRCVPADHVELEPISRGNADSTEQAVDMVTQRFDAATSPLTWPAFVAGVIDHDAVPGRDPDAPTAGFTIYYGVDHSHTDGVSVMLGVEELYALYERQVAGDPAPLDPVGSYVDFSAQERELEATLELDSPAVAVWLGALQTAGFTLPSFRLPLGLEPGETAPSIRVIIDLADAETIDAFEQIARDAGGGMSSGLFAALSTVDHELAGTDRYVALNAVGTRSDPIYRMAQGWFINLVPVAADLSEADSFEQRVTALQEALIKSRPATAMPARAVVDAVSSAMGTHGSISATAVPPMVSYLDMRRFPGAEHPDLDQVVALGGPGNTGDVSLWINRKSDRTYVMASYPNTPAAEASVTAYLTCLGEVITRTVAHARTVTSA